MESKFKMPWYPWYPADYMNAGDVMSMSPMEDLLYRRLLDLSWVGDGLPTDADKIQLLSRLSATDFKSAWPTVKKKFRVEGDRYVNSVMEQHRKDQRIKHEKRVNAGARAHGNAGSNADSNDPTNTPQRPFGSGSGSSSVSEGVKEGSGKPSGGSRIAELSNLGLGVYPAGFEEVWKAYPNKSGKAKAARAYIENGLARPSDAALVAKIAALKLGRKWADGFVPTLENWINGQGWHDEAEVEIAAAKKSPF